MVVRDPDASTEVTAYTTTSERVELVKVVVDPGSGWSRENTKMDDRRGGEPGVVASGHKCCGLTAT